MGKEKYHLSTLPRFVQVVYKEAVGSKHTLQLQMDLHLYAAIYIYNVCIYNTLHRTNAFTGEYTDFAEPNQRPYWDHEVEEFISIIMVAGILSCFSTYAEGNHPALPLHSPSDHPLGAT